MRGLAVLPWSWLHAFGRLLGHWFWRFDSREKMTTQANIARCLPELSAQQQADLVRESLIDFGQTAFEMTRLWLSPPEKTLSAVVEFEGEELLAHYVAEGRGVLVIAPHHGNWEVVGLYLGLRYGITSMYLPSDNEAINELVRLGRSRSGATLVPADTSGVRAVLKALKSGGMVGILPDQVPKGAGVEPAPFFGHPALTMTLASNLLQKTGARALVVYALRLPRGGFRMVFRAPDPAIYAEDLAQSLAGLNASVEAAARDCPAQYQWEYKRFKGASRRSPSR